MHVNFRNKSQKFKFHLVKKIYQIVDVLLSVVGK
jgi:hypothetical protein